MFGAIFLLEGLGKLTDGAMRWLEHRLPDWREAFDAAAYTENES